MVGEHHKTKNGCSLENSKNGASLSRGRSLECHGPLLVMSHRYVTDNDYREFFFTFEENTVSLSGTMFCIRSLL